jgi:outer membrane protein assembly factor BamD (BamD/ComL family)
MSATLTANEEAQLNQTIEMFEVITQSQPQDYQSLEILKEAYSKLGRQDAVVQTSKRIAEAYVQLGQLSSAILEYESILQRFPDDPDVNKALAAIESKARTSLSKIPTMTSCWWIWLSARPASNSCAVCELGPPICRS